MSTTKKECSTEYCNFQPVFEDREETHFKYYQCKDCGYILTKDDIQKELLCCALWGDFDNIIKENILFLKQNPNEYNEGFVAGMISAVYRIGIIDCERKEQYMKEAGIEESEGE